MAKHGGKWKRDSWFGVGSTRVWREVQTACGNVRVVFHCHGGRVRGDTGGCFMGEMIGPGKMRTSDLLAKRRRLGHVVTTREAMHVGDQAINEVRKLCGTRARKQHPVWP